jgi:enoyl-CoA hydratase/carnithine racemase
MLEKAFFPDSSVRVLTLARAPVNALDETLYDALHEALVEAATDTAVGSVVLASSTPKAFCAGADIKAFADLTHAQAEAKHLDLLLRCLLDLVQFPKPLVAAVHAPAIGAGLMLACACDEVVLAQTAWVSLPEAKINIPTPIGAAIAARRFSASALQSLVQRAERFDAERCLQEGFAQALADSTQVLSVAIERLKAYDDVLPAVYAANKRWLNREMRDRLQASADSVRP